MVRGRTGSHVFYVGVMGMIRLNPVHPTDDDSHVFRVFGNLEGYQISEADKDKISHGIDKSSEAPPTLEFIEEWINKTTAPKKFVASDIIWASYFRINERIANGFRKGRAFVVGGLYRCRCLKSLLVDSLHRCCTLSFACWRTRYELGIARW